MQFTIGLILGLGIGFGLIALSRMRNSAEWPRWALLSLGVIAGATFVIGILGFIDVPFAAIPSLALPFAGVVFGIGRMAQGDRNWQSIAGLTLAAIPGLFWIVFAVGELAVPH